MNVAREIQKLQQMSVAGLREKWAELFGEPARSRNRRFLWRRLAWRLQEIEKGGLSERAKRRAEELARDADLRQRLPKGALATAPASDDGATVVRAFASSPDPRLPPPGTVLVRDFRGRRIVTKVLENGFEYEGEVFRSLSAVAKAATGTHWNGYAFFGAAGKGGGR